MVYKRAAAIIIKENKILLLHRIKNKKHYYILSGGTMEEGETPEQTVVRELQEEASIKIKIDTFLFEYIDDIAHGYYFLVTDFDGEIELGGEEKERANENDQYIFEWHNISDLKKINFQPQVILDKILSFLS